MMIVLFGKTFVERITYGMGKQTERQQHHRDCIESSSHKTEWGIFFPKVTEKA